MTAPKGNQFWEIRTRHGRNRRFTPQSLWDAACEYFQWCDDNPLMRIVTVKVGKHIGKQVSVPVLRPYTIAGFCIFIRITEETFRNYSKRKGYQDYFGVSERIKKIIYTQKFEGAAVGIFKPAIISRELAMNAEKRFYIGSQDGKPFQTEHKNRDVEITPDMDDKEAYRIYKMLLHPESDQT